MSKVGRPKQEQKKSVYFGFWAHPDLAKKMQRRMKASPFKGNKQAYFTALVEDDVKELDVQLNNT